MDNHASRLSNLELLRILAIVMIVMMHGCGTLLGTEFLPNRIILTLINAIGNMGVTAFILISGYFGIHFRWSRLWVLWTVAFFYSILTFIFDIWINEGMFSWQDFYHAITPITSQKWWFLTCYVVIFCLSPFLNRAASGLTKSQMQSLIAVLFFFFILSPTILRNTLTNDMEGKGLANLITAYLIGQYISRYDLPSVIIRYSGILTLISISVVFSLSFIAGCIEPKATIFFCKDNNLFIVLGAIFLFCWFRRLSFHSSTINYLSGFVFPLYLVNLSVLNCFKQSLVANTERMDFWFIYSIALGVTLFSACFIEILRRVTISWAVDRIANKISVYDL